MQIKSGWELSELITDIMSDPRLAGQFYSNFSKNLKEFDKIFENAKGFSAKERGIVLKKLIPLPEFLSGPEIFYFKVSEDDFNIIKMLSGFVNSYAPNIGRVLIYQSLPINMYKEFEFMIEHYKFIEMILNYYVDKIETINGNNNDNRFKLYDIIKNIA